MRNLSEHGDIAITAWLRDELADRVMDRLADRGPFAGREHALLAGPRERLLGELEPGDVLIRWSPGEFGRLMVGIVDDGRMGPAHQLDHGAPRCDRGERGRFARINGDGPLAGLRRITDDHGRVMPHQLLLRPRAFGESSLESEPDLAAIYNAPGACGPDPAAAARHPVLRHGTRGAAVGEAQRLLNVALAETGDPADLGRVGYALDPADRRRAEAALALLTPGPDGRRALAADCQFGPRTEAAVTLFQLMNRVAADGVIGAVTWPLLEARRPGGAPIVPPDPGPAPAPGPVPHGRRLPPVSRAVSQGFLDAAQRRRFRNAAEINEFFRTGTGASSFTDWFNAHLAGLGPFAGRGRIGRRGMTMAEVESHFTAFWDAIPVVYGRSDISIVEFACLFSIALNEVGGVFHTITEGAGRGRVDIDGTAHAGLAYIFDTICYAKKDGACTKRKASYNAGNRLGNKTCAELFQDTDFLAAHRGKALGTVFGGVQPDPAWAGTLFPAHLVAPHAAPPTSEDPAQTGFLMECDFYKYRGRGIIQTTGRESYGNVLRFILAYDGPPDSVVGHYGTAWAGQSADQILSTSSNGDWDALFARGPIAAKAIAIHAQHAGGYLAVSETAATLNRTDNTTGSISAMGRRISGSAAYGAGVFRDRVVGLLDAVGNRPRPDGSFALGALADPGAEWDEDQDAIGESYGVLESDPADEIPELEALLCEAAESDSDEKIAVRHDPPYVRWVQTCLNGLRSAGLAVDGVSGPLTKAAVRRYQASRGLLVDGLVGPQTEAALQADSGIAPPAPGAPFPPVIVPDPPIVPPTPPVPPPVPIDPIDLVPLEPQRWGPILKPKVSSAAGLRAANAVRFLIDGPQTFREMVSAIRSAETNEHYIYLLGWDMHHDLEMIPGDPDSTMKKLTAAASGRGVQIRAMLWDQPGTQNNDEVRHIDGLARGAAILDDETANKTAASRARLVAALVAAGIDRRLIPLILPLIEGDLARLTGSHHQKVLIVRSGGGLVAFCGGIDINPNRMGAVDRKGSPQHDVHCRIRGPSAFDLLATFVRRWRHHPDSTGKDRAKGALLGAGETVPAPILRPPPGESSTGGPCSVLIARTFNPNRSVPGVPREQDIRPLIQAAIANARRFIYVEDQYLIDLETAAALARAIPRLKHVTILISPTPVTAPVPPFLAEYRRDFVETMTRGLSAADRAKVNIFQPSTSPSPPPVFGAHTYVHAKSWVFDDELAVIGSANCNRRGYQHDSEVNAFIFDDLAPPPMVAMRDGEAIPVEFAEAAMLAPTFAQRLRMALWVEHLGVAPAAVLDGVASQALWLSAAPSRRVLPFDHRLPSGAWQAALDRAANALRDIIDPVP